MTLEENHLHLSEKEIIKDFQYSIGELLDCKNTLREEKTALMWHGFKVSNGKRTS